MDKNLIELECFEPAGSSLEFSREDLLGHSLALGGSGSGKTSRFVLPMLRELICSKERVGLVILDTKADGQIVKAVRKAAVVAEREADLICVDGSGQHGLDIFGDHKRFDLRQVDALASLLGSLIPRDSRNQYWEQTFEALIRQTLRLLVLREESCLDYPTLIGQLIRYLLMHRLKDPFFNEQIQRLKECQSEQTVQMQCIYDEIIATNRMWDTLDVRTRSNLQSMAASLTAPMNTPLAHDYFSGETSCSISEIVNQGKILIVSVDGIRHAQVARLIACVVKGRYYEAILTRRSESSSSIAGLVLDDWPIAVTGGWGNLYSDVEALAMIRSRGGFLVTSAQSLSVLDSIIGIADRRAALANFANLIFFRGRDIEVDLIAAHYLGERKDKMIGSILDSLPTIRSSPGVAQGLVELYQSSGLNVPVGLLDLPLYWAKAFHELIRETHWPACDACSIHDVFGWNLVIRYGGYLHIQFESPIPHQNSHWCDVGRFIVELHERFEPGLMTPASRLCEFS